MGFVFGVQNASGAWNYEIQLYGIHTDTHVLLFITMVATKTCFTSVGLFKPSYVKTHYKRPCDAPNDTD